MIGVSERTFAADVLDRSAAVPVIVVFSALWCTACRGLELALETARSDRRSPVVVLEADVEREPSLATAFGVTGLPTVLAFRRRVVVAAFVGNRFEDVTSTLDRLAPTPVDPLLDAGDPASLRAAHALAPDNAEVIVKLARSALDAGAVDEASALLAGASDEAASVAALLARVRLIGTPHGDAVERALVQVRAGAVPAGGSALLELRQAASDGQVREDLERVVAGLLIELGPMDRDGRDLRLRLMQSIVT